MTESVCVLYVYVRVRVSDPKILKPLNPQNSRRIPYASPFHRPSPFCSIHLSQSFSSRFTHAHTVRPIRIAVVSMVRRYDRNSRFLFFFLFTQIKSRVGNDRSVVCDRMIILTAMAELNGCVPFIRIVHIQEHALQQP